MSIKVTDPKKLFLVFGIIMTIGIFISIFVAFQQEFLNPYIVLGFAFLLIYFGAVGIYRTNQDLKNK